MLATADLHIHSPYSIAVSRFMQPETADRRVRDEGHPGARHRRCPPAGLAERVETVPGERCRYRDRPAGRDRGQKRVHHVILAEDLAQFDQLRDLLKGNLQEFCNEREAARVPERGRDRECCPRRWGAGRPCPRIYAMDGNVSLTSTAFRPATAVRRSTSSNSGSLRTVPMVQRFPTCTISRS